MTKRIKTCLYKSDKLGTNVPEQPSVPKMPQPISKVRNEKMNKYIIKAITHNGRKGLRGTPVDAEKYESMIGATIVCNLEGAKQFRELRWDFENHPLYDYWNTSEVLALSYNYKTDLWELETVNTIYMLKEVSNE